MNKYCLIEKQKEFNINIIKKTIKNFNIRIASDCKITCSVPIETTDEEITKFLKNKSKWITKQTEKFIKLTKISSSDVLKNGGSVNILGHQYYVSILSGNLPKVELKNRKINIYVEDPFNQDNINKQYKMFFSKEMKKHYEKVVDKFYPIFKKHKIEKPQIITRQMSSSWGTCNVKKGYITLNESLFKALPMCIEYVVLHELTHLLYSNHGKRFYDFISVHMPDWKERKNRLNSDFSMKMLK